MAALEALMKAVGQPVSSDAIQSLIDEDRVTESVDFGPEGEPQRSFLANRSGGYQLWHQRGRIDLAVVYARSYLGFQAFAGPLPGGLAVTASQDEVRRQLGRPVRGGPGRGDSGDGRHGPWDVYEIGLVSVFFCYDAAGERIRWVMIEPSAPQDIA